jgi:hypothetical protein
MKRKRKRKREGERERERINSKYSKRSLSTNPS